MASAEDERRFKASILGDDEGYGGVLQRCYYIVVEVGMCEFSWRPESVPALAEEAENNNLDRSSIY